MIEAVWPRPGVAREIVLVLGGVLLIALAAQVQIPLPFSPVPVTGQTFAVLLLGALYGSKRGAATVLTYLVLGTVGFPVFAGGAAGAARLMGPTAGYLVGFIAAAFVVGALAERGWDRRPWTTAGAMILGNLIIYAVGVAWLARFVGWDKVLATGVLPFLAGDALKIALAMLLLPAGWRLLGRAAGSDAGDNGRRSGAP
jgi:biotin transport system substrate-specific component